MSEPNANSKCAICGKDYYLCIACKDKLAAEPWRLHTDTSEHFKIYQIIRGYSTGVYTKKETKAKLKTCDLSDVDYFVPNIQRIVNDIMAFDEVKKQEQPQRKPAVKKAKNKSAKSVNKSKNINSEK